MEKNLIVAAQKTKTERYLRLSSLGANANGTDTVARIHGQAEQLLEQSGLISPTSEQIILCKCF